MYRLMRLLAVMMTFALSPAAAQDESTTYWRPAETPPGGVSWELLESTRVIGRPAPGGRGVLSKPDFPPEVMQLDGTQVKVAGWMMPLENGPLQRHFVLFGYPPGCPYHEHATPTQFIEVLADVPMPLDDLDAIIVSGRLELTGHDEQGVFYRLHNAVPG